MTAQAQINVKLPRQLKDAATAEARRQGVPLSCLIKAHLAQFLPKTTNAKQEKTK